MNTNINILNSNIYKKKLYKEDVPTLFKEYWLILKEYYKFLVENIKIKDDNEHFYFIFNRGLNTFKYILNLLLIYTKNIELIVYHLKKSYLYYVEFVGQIGHDNHAYLQLNSRDAALFVYKKTIYEINNDHKKNITISDVDSKSYILFYKLIDMFNNTIYTIVKKEKIIKKEDFFLKVGLLDKIVNKIKDNYSNINIEYLILLMEKSGYIYNNKNVCLLEIINIFINKLMKNKVSDIFLKNVSNIKNNEQIEKLSPVKYINWLIK
tara:strand:+ start:432 stop:1226 length:795 start_codon:yes stop_codon:yes gene_type:complete